MDLDKEAHHHTQLERQHQLIVLISLITSQLVYCYNLVFLTPMEWIPYHTSILTGEAWMLELLNGHPDCIRTCLGIGHGVFDHLVQILMQQEIACSWNGISVEEKLGIFLYTCVTGLSTWHVTERFQHSPATIRK